MKPSTELFELIKSLTASEKRHFKLNASLQKGNKNYIRLFEIIDSQKVYNEIVIKNKFRKEGFGKNLTFTKNYLYKLIFKSLINIYNEKSLDAKLNNILSRCRLMYDKALFPQYFKTVIYGKELAKKYERFPKLLEFLEIERQLTKKEDIPKKNMHDVYDEEINVIEKIRNSNIYKRAITSLFRIYRSEGIIRNELTDKRIDEILCAEEFKNEKNALSLTAKEKYYFALNIANELKGNSDKAYVYNKKRFEHISENKEIFQQFLFDNYEDSYIALIQSAVHAGNFSEATKHYEKYKSELSKSGADDIDTMTAFYTLKITMAIDRAVEKKEINLPYSVEKFLIKYKGKVTINNYNYLYFLLAKYFFVTGKFEESLRHLNFLFENKTLKFTIHIEHYARMLNSLVHYELGNKKLLEYLIPSTLKYLKSKNKLYKTEAVVLNFLKNINRSNNEEELIKQFELFRDEINILKKNRYEKNAFGYIDYLNWCEKKLISLN